MLLAHLPADAAIHHVNDPAGAFGWGVSEFLIADLFHALTGETHPHRPAATSRAERHRQLRERLEAQRKRLAAQ